MPTNWVNALVGLVILCVIIVILFKWVLPLVFA